MPHTAATGARRFGTFGGVFTPCTLTILGVIMFLRLGYVVGAAGVVMGLVIILISKLVTTCTTLSLSAVATNTRVQGGGAYFLISRSLGPEFGGAIGVVLYLAQAVSISLYVVGFTEAFTTNYPSFAGPAAARTIGVAVCLLLFLAAYFSAEWAIKVQYLILACLGLSILSFFVGAVMNFDPALLKENLWMISPEHPAARPGMTFWVLFAIFFPAATGIMAGTNMSGDLIDPSRSIPRGTLAAISVTSVIYLVLAVLCGGTLSRGELIDNPLMMKRVALADVLIDIGVYSATLSSALGCLVGAPRILQAYARDRIIQSLSFFGKGDPVKDEPRRAAVLTLAIALIGILVGKLNLIAPIITMFFMITYGLVNFATFYETFSDAPSFRPQFRFFHWTTALAGAGACVVIMFLISPLYALLSVIVLATIYEYIEVKAVRVRWGDARYGFLFSRARENLLKMSGETAHAKNWRPSMLVLSGNPKTRPHLVEFADAAGCRKGLVILSQILVGDTEQMMQRKRGQEKSIQSFIESHDLEAFYEVVIAPDYESGVDALVQASGIGGFKPNTVLLGWTDRPEAYEDYGSALRRIRSFGKNLIVLKPDDSESPAMRDRAIDVWWRGRENGPMMLLFAYLLRLNDEYEGCTIRILRIVDSEAGVEEATQHLQDLVEGARIDAEVHVLVRSGSPADMIRAESGNSRVVFLGLKIPDQGQERNVLEHMTDFVKGLPATAMVSAVQQIDLQA
ncbi:MAG: amino acid permease [Planctomycetes bacterium]|nr:amino acid permease [Planctomycetota bacterium]